MYELVEELAKYCRREKKGICGVINEEIDILRLLLVTKAEILVVSIQIC